MASPFQNSHSNQGTNKLKEKRNAHKTILILRGPH
jgi:hypothetical protein